METIEHTDINFLTRITEILDSAIIICDSNKKIILANSQAHEIFPIENTLENLFEMFVIPEHNKINKLFEDVQKHQTGIKEVVSLSLVNNTTFKGELSLSEYTSESDTKYYILNFDKKFTESSEGAAVKVHIQSNEITTLITNEKIVKVIEDIRSSFPFTFLGKNRIQQEINKLDEIFWLKDPNDVYLLVNKKFADALGLRPNQLEGKNERNFLPIYFLEFYKTLETYIKETLSCLVLEGVPFRGFSSWHDYQTIEIPLSDSENNVLAIIGVAQRKEITAVSSENNKIQDASLVSVEKLPCAVGMFDKDGTLISASKAFVDLLESGKNNAAIADVFSSQTSLAIKKYVDSDDTSAIHIKLTLKDDASSQYSGAIQKIYDDARVKSFCISINEMPQETNFESLIKHKGKMFDTLIQFNPEPILIYDAENLRFLEVNEAALNLYGYKRDEFLQMDLTDLYSPEDIQSLLDASASDDKTPRFQGPFKHKKKDGSTILVKIAKTSFEFEGKEAHFNIVRSAAEEETKAVEQNVIQSFMDNSSDLIFVTDITGFISEVNQAAVNKLGYAREKLIGSSIVEFVTDNSRSQVTTGIFHSGEKNPVRIYIVFKTAGGSEVGCNVKAVPVLNAKGKPESFNLIAQPEPEVKEVIKEVVKEVPVEVIKEVYVDREPVETLSSGKVKTGLDAPQIGTIFHEILTPINVILGFIQEIKESIQDPSGEQQEAINYINQNRESLLDIMNAISEYAQITSSINDLNPSELNFVEQLEAVQSEENEFFESVKKEVVPGKVSHSLTFYSDAAKYKQLLALLMKICLRLSDESTVYVSAQQYDEMSFVVSFKDNFSRISEKLVTNFDNFISKRNIGTPRDYHLSRYSFSAVNALMQVLKGKYEIITRSGKPYEIGLILPLNLFEEHAEEEQPAKFEGVFNIQKETPLTKGMDLPEVEEKPVIPIVKEAPPVVEAKPVVEKVEPKPSAPSPAPAVPEAVGSVISSGTTKKELDLSSLSCLYIEDQVDSQILFKVQMKELKDVKFAVSFEEALPLLTMQKYDFIVMDINLQGEYNGLDALKMIRQMPEFISLPVIAVTAYVLPGDKDKFIAAGFTDFISKPIFREKMISALEKIFA
jgi:PAS domain S-box-containing protein